MAYWYFTLVVLACVVTRGYCDYDDDEDGGPDYTITHEAWFDIEIKDHEAQGEDYRGRIIIGLFGREVPVTALNFYKLARGYKSKDGPRTETLSFKNTIFHRLVRDFVIQGGDVTKNDGTGGKSIFGKKFDDESFGISHKAKGYVSMANHGRDTNGSQFIILLNKARWLDGKHVVFGKIVRGMDVVKVMGEVETVKDTGKPKKRIKIVDCGAEELDTKYTLTDEEASSDNDVDRETQTDK